MSKNPVVHFEMPYTDAKRVSEFYSKAFGWGMNDAGENMGNYIVAVTADTDENRMVKTSGTINGGFYQKTKVSNPNPSFVISVENLEEAIKAVTEAGGKVQGEPQDIPGIGKWVVFIDTEGNKVSLLQAKM